MVPRYTELVVEDENACGSNSDDCSDGAEENALRGHLACQLGDGYRCCDLLVYDAQGQDHSKRVGTLFARGRRGCRVDRQV